MHQRRSKVRKASFEISWRRRSSSNPARYRSQRRIRTTPSDAEPVVPLKPTPCRGRRGRLNTLPTPVKRLAIGAANAMPKHIATSPAPQSRPVAMAGSRPTAAPSRRIAQKKNSRISLYQARCPTSLLNGCAEHQWFCGDNCRCAQCLATRGPRQELSPSRTFAVNLAVKHGFVAAGVTMWRRSGGAGACSTPPTEPWKATKSATTLIR